MLSIAKGDVVLDVKPPSLRFWEKLGLSPKGGTKDFEALVLFEDDALGGGGGMGGEARRVWVEGWVEGLRDVYRVCFIFLPFCSWCGLFVDVFFW